MTHLNAIKEAIRSMAFKKAWKRGATIENVSKYLDDSMRFWNHTPIIQAFIRTLKFEIEEAGIDLFCRIHQMAVDAKRTNKLPSASFHKPEVYTTSQTLLSGGLYHGQQ